MSKSINTNNIASIKVTGVKSAISDYNQCDNFNRYGIFYLDTASGKVWCNMYTDSNSYDIYHNKDIITVSPCDYMDVLDKKMTMQILKDICIIAINQHNSKVT